VIAEIGGEIAEAKRLAPLTLNISKVSVSRLEQLSLTAAHPHYRRDLRLDKVYNGGFVRAGFWIASG
jgi:hypothetical protein